MSISPERIFSMMMAHVQSAAFNGGIDLGLFTAIGEGHNIVAAVAQRCGASERGARILCDYRILDGCYYILLLFVFYHDNLCNISFYHYQNSYKVLNLDNHSKPLCIHCTGHNFYTL